MGKLQEILSSKRTKIMISVLGICLAGFLACLYFYRDETLEATFWIISAPGNIILFLLIVLLLLAIVKFIIKKLF